jgi:hypothetical protein
MQSYQTWCNYTGRAVNHRRSPGAPGLAGRLAAKHVLFVLAFSSAYDTDYRATRWLCNRVHTADRRVRLHGASWLASGWIVDLNAVVTDDMIAMTPVLRRIPAVGKKTTQRLEMSGAIFSVASRSADLQRAILLIWRTRTTNAASTAGSSGADSRVSVRLSLRCLRHHARLRPDQTTIATLVNYLGDHTMSYIRARRLVVRSFWRTRRANDPGCL